MHGWPRIRGQNRPLVRADGSVQFGIDPRDGIRLVGMSAEEVAWVSRLDGSTDVAAAAADAGVDPRRREEILAVLRASGILVSPGSARARWGFAGGNFEQEVAAAGAAAHDVVLDRQSACVWVHGRGQIAASIAATLLQAGVGRIERDAPSGDSMRYRRRPDLVVLTAAEPVPEEAGSTWVKRGIPHLPVALTAGGVSVGPLVLPGIGPCLGCMERVRTDLDPSWRWLRAQLAAPPDPASVLAVGECALTTIGAGLAARVVVSHLDGTDTPVGVALEVAAPWPEMVQRRWPRHPDCGCVGEPSPAAVTMLA
ncbi:MAG: hypothetical protein V9G19_24930 [Tetrasphaera sp.]